MERGALLNILLEHGVLGCMGARSGNAKRGSSVELWLCVERGLVKSNSIGARSVDAKTGRSAGDPRTCPNCGIELENSSPYIIY